MARSPTPRVSFTVIHVEPWLGRAPAGQLVIIRAVLPPGVGKALAETLNTIIQHVAATPTDPSAGGSNNHTAASP